MTNNGYSSYSSWGMQSTYYHSMVEALGIADEEGISDTAAYAELVNCVQQIFPQQRALDC